MGRWEPLAAAVVAAAIVTGCEMSAVDPDAQVTVRGTVVDGATAAQAEHDVVLLTEPTASDVLFGLPFGLGSLGFACLVDDPPPPCDTRRRTTTGADGSFAFTLTGRETQGTFGEAAKMTASTRAPARAQEAAGPATTGAFVVRAEQVDLEPLPLVRASPALSVRGARAVVDWAWQGGTGMRGAPSSAEIVFQDGHEPLWVASASPDSSVDLRVLEDVPGALAIVEHRRTEGTVDDLTYRSELVPYASGAGAPVSRGASCRVVAQDGSTVPVSPCPVTDGDLTGGISASLACDDPACSGADGFVVDLGSDRPVELLVVRGCDEACPLGVSSDGATWHELSEVHAAFATVDNDGPVRYVRVTGDAGLHGLAEISAWDGPPAAATFAVRSLPAGPRGGATTEDGASASRLRWAAGVLVVLAAVGLGVAVGRRWT